MPDAIYTIVIYPVTLIIEFVFVFADKIFKETGLSVAGVSVAISLLCLPLYEVAEKWQQTERDTIKRLKPGIDKIKAVFRGDERFMILQTYYRQNHYHPVYAMRSTFGLLIQIPFFIAGYTYLSHLEALRGASFLFIKDLGAPDRLLSGINVLPVLMTLINCAAGAIYTKGFPAKDRIQVYGMSALFLVLLYNSPAGLVLYWTLNNVFSLVKHCLHKLKHPLYIVYAILLPVIAAANIYILCFREGPLNSKMVAVIFIDVFLFIPLLVKAARYISRHFNLQDTALSGSKTYIFSALALFLLTGLVIPSALIASSVIEFSFITPYHSPFPFLAATLTQAAGIFLFWFLIVYCFFSKQVRLFLTLAAALLEVLALAGCFIFPGDYGFLTPTLVFSNANAMDTQPAAGLFNTVTLLALSAAAVLLLLSKHRKIFLSAQAIIILTLAASGLYNTIKINTDFRELLVQQQEHSGEDDIPEPVYRFSRTGKNVLVIMLDRAIPGYIPDIFKEKPALEKSFKDFTFYPDCVSLGGYTLLGVPPLFGGYEYSPEEMQKQNKRLLVDQYNEALLVLPELFAANGFKIIVTDPPRANFKPVPDLHIYDSIPGVNAKNLYGSYTARWLKKHPDLKLLSVSKLLKTNLMHFAFFKCAPVFLREHLYDEGGWLTTEKFNEGSSGITKDTIDNYALLDTLPEITKITDEPENIYIAMNNDLTHEPAFFRAPDYVPANDITNRGTSPYAGEDHYHANMAAISLLGKWFDFLQEHNAYDNTRIIIASDHGWSIDTTLPDFNLPGGTRLISFNSLLMVKDFTDGSGQGIKTDPSFMTQADVPFLAAKDITGAINPFTGRPLNFDKERGVIISTVANWEPPDPAKYTWNIKPGQWLRIRGSIFDRANWEQLTLP